MAEDNKSSTKAKGDAGKASAEQPAQQFALQKIYVKDVSFETPNSPAIFTQKWEPEINIELHTNGKRLTEELHEVVLGITVTAKMEDKVAYLVEINQAGIFGITGYEQTELEGLLGSFCPGVLFPYAREAVSDLVTRGGFPQMLLAPVNFDAIYQEHLKKRAEGEKGTEQEIVH